MHRPVFLSTHKKHIHHNGIRNSLVLYNHQQKGVVSDIKKNKIKILLLTMALCASAVLSGCATKTLGTQEPNQSITATTPRKLKIVVIPFPQILPR